MKKSKVRRPNALSTNTSRYLNKLVCEVRRTDKYSLSRVLKPLVQMSFNVSCKMLLEFKVLPRTVSWSPKRPQKPSKDQNNGPSLSLDNARYINIFIKWLNKMNRILHSDWLSERARWAHQGKQGVLWSTRKWWIKLCASRLWACNNSFFEK